MTKIIANGLRGGRAGLNPVVGSYEKTEYTLILAFYGQHARNSPVGPHV
jgi:hypothetical protein